ncbi:MAG: PadR family transcriptional regulator [Simkaniaceae bacterium]|nr:MAG: PadR family transcriptional regulator [Simkaniaceae bacterium]
MKSKNKTRYAILGMLLDSPLSGYEIKLFMVRSTVYFWRESDSTIYPMLKVLAKEGKVRSKSLFVGRKRKEVFSITDEGRAEFDAWMVSPTGSEIPRNEFLLKLFFITGHEGVIRLFQERLERSKNTYEEYKKIEERLEGLIHSPRREIRLKALRYGIAQLTIEIQWLNKEILEYAYY